MTVNMDWLRQKVRSREAKPIWYDGLGDMERLEEYRAYSALLGFLEGYDPAERKPPLGKRVWLKTKTGRQDYGCFSLVEGSKVCFGPRDEYLWECEIERWHPLPGGER